MRETPNQAVFIDQKDAMKEWMLDGEIYKMTYSWPALTVLGWRKPAQEGANKPSMSMSWKLQVSLVPGSLQPVTGVSGAERLTKPSCRKR
jgi:hypothetical protein